MALGDIRLLLLLSHIPPSSAMTEYIGDNVTIAGTSVQRCHLFGDSDLFGLGVRASFYISWATSLLGLFLSAVQGMKSPRLSFNVLFLALLIILINNTNRGGFALLEWYIVTGLAWLCATTLFVQPVPAYGFNPKEEGENKGQHAETSSQHHSSPGNEHAGVTRQNMHVEGLTNNSQEEATDDGNFESTSQTKRELSEEQRRKDAEARVNKLSRSIYYSDPLGLGFLVLLYGIFWCCQPWLYFTKYKSGHKDGCAVPIVFFGTRDMYNKHWQVFQKIDAAGGPILGALLIISGFYMVFNGLKMQRTYALTLYMMKERRYSVIKLLGLDVANLKRALNYQETVTRTETQIRERSNAIQQLAKAIQWARNQEEEIATEVQAQHIVNEASELQDHYRETNILVKLGSGFVFIFMAISGGLTIWFLEKTIKKNHIDMDNDISSSSGQLLALLVAILTTMTFLWEVVKSRFEERKIRKNAEEKAANIYNAASSLYLRGN
ncbi:hypothetical protein BFJ70_g16487 [Fusarium oxysporum]|nr:hypothetical protein BFJ70_g16487 [Fusarium oxysporum]